MTDDIPPTDADKAREVMVDELKTINKYEEMARQAKNPKVAEVINEVAGDEKVHVGNAAALVAMEDPEAVPKMEEGLRETEKDTGVKVSREFKRHISKEYGRGKNAYVYIDGRPVHFKISPAPIMTEEERKKSDRDHQLKLHYQTLTELGKFDGTLEEFDQIFDEYFDRMMKFQDHDPMELLRKVRRKNPKLESFDEQAKAEAEAEEKAKKEAERKKAQDEYTRKGEAVKWATVDGTVPPKKPDAKKDGDDGGEGPDKDEALERYEAEFKESREIDALILERQGFRKAKPDNVLIDDQYEQLPDGTIRTKEAIMDDPTGQMAADKRDKIEADLDTINELRAEKEMLEANRKSQKEIENLAIKMAAMGARLDPLFLQSLDEMHPDDLARLNEEYRAKAQEVNLNQTIFTVISKEIEAIIDDNQKTLDRYTRIMPYEVELKKQLSEIMTEESGASRDEPVTKEQKIRNRVPRQYLKEEEAAEAEQSEEDYKRYLIARREARKRQAAKDYEDIARLKQRAAEGDPKAAGLLREMQMEDAAFDERHMHVDPNTGEFDETKVFPYQSNRDKNVYTTPEGIEINPYHYSFTEDSIGDRVKGLRSRSSGEEYGLASKSWLQGIMDILEAAEPARYRFPKDTFFDRVGYRDVRGALDAIGITTVGQLRKFIDYYDNLYQGMRDQVKEGKMTWPEANDLLKKAVIKDYKPRMRKADKKFFMDNFVNDAYGFGGKYVSGSGNSPTMNLYEKIQDLPDDTPIGIGYEHPDFDETEEGRQRYADWIGMKYTTSSNEALARINPMFLALKNAVALYTDPGVDEPAVNDAVKKALAAVSKYIDDTQPNGDKAHDDMIKNERAIGIKVLRAIETLRNKMTEYDEQSDMGAGRGDTTERMYGMFDRVLDNLYGKLAQEVYGAGYYEYNKRTAQANGKAILDDYLEKIELLSYFMTEMPPLTQAALNDVADELKTIDWTFKARTKGTPEYAEAASTGIKPQIDVKYLFSDRFQKFAKPMIDQLDAALVDDGNEGLMFDIEAYAGDDPGAKYRMGDLAAELYLMRGKDNSVASIRDVPAETQISPEVEKLLSEQGSGMSYSDALQTFEKLQGIKRKNISGYFNQVNPEDQDAKDPGEKAEEDDQYVKRRLDNISGIGNPGQAIMLMPHGQMDDVTILDPADVGMDNIDDAKELNRRYLARGALPVELIADLDEDTLRDAILTIRDDPRADLAPVIKYDVSSPVELPEMTDEERAEKVANQERMRKEEEKARKKEEKAEAKRRQIRMKTVPKEVTEHRAKMSEEEAEAKERAATAPSQEELHQQDVAAKQKMLAAERDKILETAEQDTGGMTSDEVDAANDRADELLLRELELPHRPYEVNEKGETIYRSATSLESKRPPLRVTHVFSQAIPFYGIKLDLNANEPFDAAKYKMVKKEVQGSTHKKVSRVFKDRQKH